LNLAGSGIGSFSDRMRDAVRGGSPFDGPSNDGSVNYIVKNQGFINGMFYDKNAFGDATVNDLNRTADMVRLGLAGTLSGFAFEQADGSVKTGAQMNYNGQKAGYTDDPQEVVNYVEAHDNETLFDINAYKLPLTTTAEDRVRVQNLGNALTMLSQGVPFFQAGQDLLRSKSMDRDSYNSGDWFNRIDWSYQVNNFAVGAPIASKNQGNWSVIKPILANAMVKPSAANIASARDYFQDLLKIRKSSTLFRMRTAADIKQRLKFYNTGTTQVPGVIVLGLDGNGYAGASYRYIATLFNVTKEPKTVSVSALANMGFAVHSVQTQSTADTLAKTATYTANTGTFVIPARSTVVFVKP